MIVAALALSPAHADHQRYLYEGANLGEDAKQSNYTGMPYYWLDKHAMGWCPSAALDVPAVTDAVTAWRASTPWPFDELVRQCGGPYQHVSILNRWQDAGFPPGCVNRPACTEIAHGWDAAREGWYVASARVWVNNVTFGYPNYEGTRAVVTHELGHVYGLADAYHHVTDPPCNGNFASIMDAFTKVWGGTKWNITNGCYGYWLQPYDTYHVDLMYRANHPAFQPMGLGAWRPGPGQLAIKWDDVSPAEWGYAIGVYRWDGSNWVQVPGTWYWHSNATGDHAQASREGFVWPRPSSQPAALYRGCIYTVTYWGPQYFRCTNWVWVG